VRTLKPVCGILFKYTEIMTPQNMRIYEVFVVWDHLLYSELASFDSQQVQEFFSPPCPDLLWGPPSVLSNRYRVQERVVTIAATNPSLCIARV
jgi:hypothetical protein